MGEALRAYLLKESLYSLEPPSGKALYFTSESLKVEEEELLPSVHVDPRIPYALLNPLQTLFYKLYRDGNALVASPTSSGKSLIAYLFMKKYKGRLVYTAPTRALVKEKTLELKRYYPKDVEIRTGESVLENFKNPRARVVVSTYEHLAYAFRNSAQWVSDLDAVVVDEVHQVSKRWILEEIITACIRSGIPMLCLSATLPGVYELASWLGASLIIESAWRPVPLHREVRRLVEFEPVGKREDDTREELIAGRLFGALFALRKREEKVILFVPKKSLGWKLLELAKEEKIGIMNQTLPFDTEEEKEAEIAFHNADVPKEEREQIEKAFREGDLNILIATQTLAYGVNLPADRVIIMVRFFKKLGKLKSIPDNLDILQMEGRAGRLGIKDEGYSNILVYGAREKELQRKLEEALNSPLKTAIMEEQDSMDSLSFFLLLAHMYEGKNYQKYLKGTYSFKKVRRERIEEVEDFLKSHGYLQNYKPTEKGLFCVRSGMPPTRFEDFLQRKALGLDLMITIRPLLHMKKFDGLFEFLRRKERFEEDLELIRGVVFPCGRRCLEDNTDQFIFYIEGLTARYSNLKNPPGEFSYLGTDSLHLVRTLMEIDAGNFYRFTPMDIVKIAHSVKYGINPDYSSLAGIKGIGHIRANLIKECLLEAGMQAPELCSPTEAFLETFKSLKEPLLERIILYRGMSYQRAEEERRKIMGVVQNNTKGHMVDDRILLAFGLFSQGPQAFRMRKKELMELLLETKAKTS
ncbi:MAG: helicase-related protein [Aquificaceae bacterium]|nr:helicase-related protein [Aquificaceae bacterium]